MHSRALTIGIFVLSLAGCRNRHLAMDEQHQVLEDAQDRYQRDCPVTVTANDPAKARQCQAEHQQLVFELQKTQATDRGDCDRPPASRPDVCRSRNSSH